MCLWYGYSPSAKSRSKIRYLLYAPCVQLLNGIVACFTAYVLTPDHLQRIIGFTESAALKWKKIGVALKFPSTTLNEIATTSEGQQRGPAACFTDAMKRWLDSESTEQSVPTLGALCEALRCDDVGEEELAIRLEREFSRMTKHTLSVSVLCYTPYLAFLGAGSEEAVQPSLSSLEAPLLEVSGMYMLLSCSVHITHSCTFNRIITSPTPFWISQTCILSHRHTAQSAQL